MGAGPGLLAVMVVQQNPEIDLTAIDLYSQMDLARNHQIEASSSRLKG
jgi:tRNA1(Val) A37 N6-methylase TrmN6